MKPSLAPLMTSKTDDWATPQAFFDLMNAKYGPFDLDVAASNENSKCLAYFGLDVGIDGLQQEWVKYEVTGEKVPARCWMNPPYGRGIGAWVKKAYEESQKGCLVVCLLPARTCTRWFHDYCLPFGEVEFIRGRLRFGNAKHAAPFPSMFVVFRPQESK